MDYFMKHIIIIICVAVSTSICGQQNIVEISPELNTIPNNSRQIDTLNLQFSFPCTAFIGEYGVESNGTNIYVTQWLDDSIAKYDLMGNIIEKFEIDGVGRTRDMAYDGQNYYGSPNEFYFYILDLDNKILIDQVNTSFKIRGMAYDFIEDVLWATEMWDPKFYKIDMNGNILDSWMASGITLGAISGLAYDNDSEDGPFLWGFSQDSTGAVVVKYDIASQSQTGNVIDVSGLVDENAVAGGLYMRDMNLKTTPAIGGLIQNQLVFAFELNYANSLVDIEDNFISKMKIYPNPAANFVTIELGFSEEPVLLKLYDTKGNLINNYLIANDKYTINTTDLNSGTYFIDLSIEGKFSIIRKLLVE